MSGISSAAGPARTAGDTQDQLLGELPAQWARHPFVRGDSPRWQHPQFWHSEEALLVSFTGRFTPIPGRERSLLVIGAPEAGAQLLRAHAEQALGDLPPRSVSLSRGTGALLPAGLRESFATGRVSHWDWMWTEQVPLPVPREDQVQQLTAREHGAAISALQDLALPGTHFTAERAGSRWFGWFDETGQLRCAVGATDFIDVVHMGGIATHPQWQGLGLGTAVITAVTRAGVERFGQASLGLYADNVGARRLYERLGFTLGMEVESHHPS